MKIFINQALRELNIGRTKLYKVLSDANIKPKKEGKKSYLTNTQISEIKDILSINNENEQFRTDERTDKTFSEYRIEQLEKELAQERESNKQLTLQVGQWQGRAKTLEEQNVKLLEAKTSPPTKKEPSKKFWWEVWK